jgi:hypothetical protein
MSAEQELQIIDKGNSKTKLTVTPTRVTLKLGKNEDPTSVALLKTFAQKIVDADLFVDADVYVDQSYRGTVHIMCVVEVCLKNNNRTKNIWISMTKEGELSVRSGD